MEKAEAEFQNVEMDAPDTTDTLERKIQGKLRSLKKEGKFDDETYKDIYPSGSLTPSANPLVKAHKPNKDFPARLVTSHIGAPQEHLASHLNQILKTYIENNPFICKNSFNFVNQLKNLKLQLYKIMASYNASALFPSVPIEAAIRHILELLEADKSLPSRTKLTPYDIADLIHLCLSTSDFNYDGRHHTTKDSGPIGLSLMVTVSQLWMTHTMTEARKITQNRQIALPRFTFICMDDIWCVVLNRPSRTGLRNSPNTDQPSPALQFKDCLNAVHPRVQFTIEEEKDKSIAFLDVFVTRHDDGKLSTRIYQKPSNTNICIKPQSCQNPQTAMASFKGDLCRCYRLCTSMEQTKKEIEFTINLYRDNGHDRQKLEKNC